MTTAAEMELYAEECGYISSIDTSNGFLRATAYNKPTLNIYIDVKGV